MSALAIWYAAPSGCDHMCKCRWTNITHPGCASDYNAWLTSDLGMQLKQPNQTVVMPGYTIFGDNSFVKSTYMSISIPGKSISPNKDAYSFYFSQLHITTEQAFGIHVL
ncbi:hypothetical protein ACHAW6_009140 [Cyclotella cf. meneghiniana]